MMKMYLKRSSKLVLIAGLISGAVALLPQDANAAAKRRSGERLISVGVPAGTKQECHKWEEVSNGMETRPLPNQPKSQTSKPKKKRGKLIDFDREDGKIGIEAGAKCKSKDDKVCDGTVEGPEKGDSEGSDSSSTASTPEPLKLPEGCRKKNDREMLCPVVTRACVEPGATYTHYDRKGIVFKMEAAKDDSEAHADLTNLCLNGLLKAKADPRLSRLHARYRTGYTAKELGRIAKRVDRIEIMEARWPHRKNNPKTRYFKKDRRLRIYYSTKTPIRECHKKDRASGVCLSAEKRHLYCKTQGMLSMIDVLDKLAGKKSSYWFDDASLGEDGSFGRSGFDYQLDITEENLTNALPAPVMPVVPQTGESTPKSDAAESGDTTKANVPASGDADANDEEEDILDDLADETDAEETPSASDAEGADTTEEVEEEEVIEIESDDSVCADGSLPGVNGCQDEIF